VFDVQRPGLCETRTLCWRELDSNYRFRASGVTVLSLRLSPQVPSFSSGAVRGHHARDRRRHAAGRTRSPLRLAVTGI